MTGRLSKLRRRRDTAAPGLPPGPDTAPSDRPPAVVAPTVPAPLFADAPPASAPAGPVPPADVDPWTTALPSFRDRGQFRRRLRYLRRVRELGFRDLGGLVFDLHRFGRTGDEIVRGKLVALDAVDRELRALERVLRDQREFTDLREPGIAACARCGGLHGSDARFCPSCGLALSGPTVLGVPAAGPPEPLSPATDGPPAIPVASPIMPLPEPEPVAAAAPAPEPVVDAPTADGDEAGARTPVSAAALGLPVPPPPPVPPLPQTDADADADQPTAVLPRVDGDHGR